MTSVLANDTLSGLPQLGSDLGSFLTALAPGVGTFIIIMAIFGGIGALIYGIVYMVKHKVGK